MRSLADRVAQGGDDRVLAEHLAESLGPQAAVQRAGMAVGVGGGVGHRLGCGHQRAYRTPIAIRRVNGRGRAPGVEPHRLALTHVPGSSQVVPRHPKAIAYRCFLPDLTGFTDHRCAGPDFQRRARWWWANGAGLDREFSPAVADCGYRAPLVPRLARPAAMVGRCGDIGQSRGGGEGGIRTHDGLPRTAFPVPRPRPLGDLSPSERGGLVAERVGFEPTVRLLAHRFSRAAPSTTRTPLHAGRV